MSGIDETKTRTLSLRPTSRLSKSRPDGGRSTRDVVVQKVRRRKPEPATIVKSVQAAPQVKVVAPAAPVIDQGTLTGSEHEARLNVLAEAKVREEDIKLQRAKTQARREEEDKNYQKQREDEVVVQTEQALAPAPQAESAKPLVARKDVRQKTTPEFTATPEKRKIIEKRDNSKVELRRRREQKDNRSKLTLSNAMNSGEERTRSVASFRRRVEREKRKSLDAPKEKVKREITIAETITVRELASRMAETAVKVIRVLMEQGSMAKSGDVIDGDMAQMIAEEMGHLVRRTAESDVEIVAQDRDASEMVARSPVVTVMGHVDHGKTSILDAIRSTSVATGEKGGITQHIGAYQVALKSGQVITFIDTPGHEAFSSMRVRGADITDIVILVVAADAGVMPQTIEAISHARAANVPIILAINKMDLEDADPLRVRTELTGHSVIVESMGGENLEVEVSAATGQGLDNLLDATALQAELMDLKAFADGRASGVVLEASLDKNRGAVSTFLVKSGELKRGDILVAGSEVGRVRALFDYQGKQLKVAGPSTPIELLGMSGAPEAGEEFVVVESEAVAREIADYRARIKREKAQTARIAVRGGLEAMLLNSSKAKDSEIYSLVIKADTRGSLEAITQAATRMGTDEVKFNLSHGGVGAITQSDVNLAITTGAQIIGFNVRATPSTAKIAEENAVSIRYYSIIFDLIDAVKADMSGLLTPEMREVRLGEARILEVFDISRFGKVAGCLVEDGQFERGARARLIRGGNVLHEGRLSTLRRFKDNVNLVQSGQECGLSFEAFRDLRADDVIECFRIDEYSRTI